MNPEEYGIPVKATYTGIHSLIAANGGKMKGFEGLTGASLTQYIYNISNGHPIHLRDHCRHSAVHLNAHNNHRIRQPINLESEDGEP